MSRTEGRAVPTPSAWQALAEGRTAESYARGTMIYTPDQPAEHLFLVASGQVGLYLRSPEGRPLTLRMVEAGSPIGHLAVSDGQRYETYAEATASARLYRIPTAEVIALVEHEPALGLALLEDFGRHRALVSARIDEVAFKSVPARLASLLLDIARRHGGPQAAHLPRHSHRQLAEMINAYRETVTKVINQFRDARLLEIERHTIMLLNLHRLEELAQG
ncbi:MAG TPA: Crp/Fnr family transcriptional regulator [Roseiflexaceae bacterium]|nr:Crp/Fnr family transcriptional regulator [Roseiflexaceae bacterium]